MPNLFFSIIIPTYNRANFIAKTIQSVLNQTYPHYEIIVVDDGSKDNTEEIVLSLNDQRIRYYKKENAERGAARNYGIKKAKGNYITFLDSDDILYPNYLEKANLFINKNKSIDIFHQLFEVKKTNGVMVQAADYSNNNVFKSLIDKGNFMACQGMFLQTDFANSNLFIEDRNLAGSEDYELWLRIAANSIIKVNPVVTSSLITHEDRSVVNFDVAKLIQRKELMLHYLFSNGLINKKLLKYKVDLKSGAYSYIALHIALSKKSKKIALQYLIKSVIASPRVILKKRFFAIVKHLLF